MRKMRSWIVFRYFFVNAYSACFFVFLLVYFKKWGQVAADSKKELIYYMRTHQLITNDDRIPNFFKLIAFIYTIKKQ